MIGSTLGLTVTFAALALFAWVGVRGATRFGVDQRDPYLTARATQGAAAVALSFFASALGAWILFAPPEVGTFGGALGIAGYAVGQAVAVAIFAWLGPAVRAHVPRGSTVLDFVRQRFGRGMQAYAGGISVLYMFLFLTAELTAVGGVVALLSGIDPLVPIVAVAAVTAAYTAYGGLPASLHTDRWQAWLIATLLVAGAVAVFAGVEAPLQAARAGGAWAVGRTGAELFVVLMIAVVAANLFHQGFWQRVWASRDDRVLVRGTVGAGIAIVPMIAILGLGGAVAAGRGALEVPSLAFFTLLEGLPSWVVVGVVGLAVALVCSTVDTLQNALTSLGAVHVAGGRITLGAARAITVALTVPAAVIALQGHSVLRLFLVADLLAATIAVPVFAGLWRRVPHAAAVAGAVAGLAGIVALGWITRGSLWQGVVLLTLPEGPAFGAFVVAPLASAAVTLAVTLATRTRRPVETAAA